MAKKKTGKRKTGRRKQVTERRELAAARRKRATGTRAQAARSRKPSGGSRKRTTAKPSATAKARATVTGAVKGAVAAVAKRIPGTAIDALTLLENDHRRLEDLLKRGEETGERAATQRKALLDTIATELTIHETIEERILYPALEEHPETRAIVLEGFQEHHVADLIMKELYDTPVSQEEWGAKFKVFKENIEHHIEEEEGPMFRTARGVMSRDDLVALGEKMAAMKASIARGATPAGSRGRRG